MNYYYFKKCMAVSLAAALILNSFSVYAAEEAPVQNVSIEEQNMGVTSPEESIEASDDNPVFDETDLPTGTIAPDPTPGENGNTESTTQDQNSSNEQSIETEPQTEEQSVQNAGESTGPSETNLTIDKKGIATVLAKNYPLPTNVKEVRAYVWSAANGQDDLKCYTMNQTEQGWKAEVDLYKHASKDDVFYFHLYYLTADNKLTCFTTKEITTTDVFQRKLEATETADGYKLTIYEPAKTPTKVQFAIWSETGGQDDLKWFTANYNAATDSASCLWNLSSLKHYGKIIIHCYITDASGKMIYQGSMNVTVGQPAIGTIQATLDPGTGAYRVVLSDIQNMACISKIQVPAWSDPKQADIIWHTAKKNSDGTYTVDANLSSHGNRKGEYQVHVYITDLFGARSFAIKSSFSTDKPEEEKPGTGDSGESGSGESGSETDQPSTEETESRTEELISDDGMCEIRAINYSIPANAKNMRVAIWSDQGGQDDLRWYTLSKKEEVRGEAKNTVWYSKFDLKNHGAQDGLYFAHFYYDDSTGKPVCISPYSFQIKDLFHTKLTVEKNASSYRLTLSSANVAAKSIRFAIWSETGGQDDLKWYEGTYNTAKNEAVVEWKADNLKHTGKVFVHAYAVKNDGSMVFQDKTELTVGSISAEQLTVDFTKNTGAFKINLTGVKGVAKTMRAAVWNDPKQADIKWYTMSQSSDGTWTYTGKISDHGYRTGSYNVHVYATDITGNQVLCKTAVFQAELAGELKISEVQKNYQYQCSVTGLPSTGINGVRIAVWSDQNGQDDIRWYTAVKSGSAYTVNVPIKNHKTLGTYLAHTYVTRSDGTQYTSKSLQTSFTIDTAASDTYVYIDRQKDNGTFVVRNEIIAYTDPSSVTFSVWTDKDGQDDLETVTASQQSDGYWAAVINPAKHIFESGVYKISGTAVFADGHSYTLSEGSFQLSESEAFYTVVVSESEAQAIVQGYTDAGSVTIQVWSLNGGKDDLRSYTATSTENGWTSLIRKADHGSAGQYQADLYVDGTYTATDLFSFDENRLADSWSSISSAHGAGGQGVNHSDIYTNCLSAMHTSYAQGYRTFEIDVLLTSDGEPVLFHTWNTNILDRYTYSSATKAGPTYKAFMSDTMYGGKYATSDFKQLLSYLSQHPDVKVLLDTKYRTASEMKTLYAKLQQKASETGTVSVMRNQIIPYFFAPDQLTAIKSVSSFKEYHYATYGSYSKSIGTFPPETFRSLLQFCKMNQVLSISMWDTLATAELIRMADSYGINVYVHTTDDPATAARLLKLGAAGIITNTITPVQALGFLP